MNGEISQWSIISTLLILAAVSASVYYFLIYRKGQRKQADLKAAYDEALKSGDKRKALEAGRDYYSSLRDGKLTIYDEQAITNDLNVMQ